MRLRLIIALLGLALTALAAVPLLLLWGAFALSGGWAVLSGVAALLTSPLLWLWFLGPKVLVLAIRGLPVDGVITWGFPRRASQQQQPDEPDVVEGRFE